MEAIIKFLNKIANSYKSSLIRQGPHYAKPVKCVCLVPKGLYGFPKTTGPPTYITLETVCKSPIRTGLVFKLRLSFDSYHLTSAIFMSQFGRGLTS